MRRNFFIAVSLSTALLSSTASAETPNLVPGLWAYTHTTRIEGPVSVEPQTTKNQQCVTQADLDKGIDVLEIPENCKLTRVDIERDRADYAAQCDMQGMQSRFSGYATFHGEQMQGKMHSEMDTPLGKMLMKMDYKAQRMGNC
ncbi:DUF3617 family protein [Methylophaga sp.]|jgi:hypothetical protein|uniref:DUF3617 domain-containing protein n=1 Tax=Methylophaga sp. TaxID=2024840 RepID=UPI0013FF544A|nr:DUF3617 family protein [Methylophaga sp.]MTI64086.1 DUF3617 family protein [Methylophaga sp.]